MILAMAGGKKTDVYKRQVQISEGFAGQRVHGAVGVDDLNKRQLVASTDLKILLVVSGRDFQDTSAEFKVHMIVADNRDEFLRGGHLRRCV